MTLQHIKLMAFDADDTLWDCQSHFDRVEQSFCQLLAEYGDAHTLSTALFETEKRNMPTLGYGTKAFTLSLIETAIAVSNAHHRGSDANGTLAAHLSHHTPARC